MTTPAELNHKQWTCNICAQSGVGLFAAIEHERVHFQAERDEASARWIQATNAAIFPEHET